jgi:hypothetical protein
VTDGDDPDSGVPHPVSFVEHHIRDKVFECEVPVGTTAEDLFRLFNQHPSELDSGDMFYPILRDYRAKKLRSMSVGDCLVMNGHALAVVQMGFEPVISGPLS